jgi:ABC-type transport system involved in multi-copper enzyme maturation permease subunit
MNKLALPFDVMIFELRRSLTIGRIAIWILLVAFPVAIITAMSMIAKLNLGPRYNPEELIEPFGMAMYFLIPEVTCLLGLLLWATPAVSTEIEGQTWVYLTMRSSGRSMVLIGKYLTAVVWTLSAALLAVALCCVAVGPTIGGELWWVLSLLVILSCFAHAALYLAIGAVFYRRTMVAAVLYTVVVEYVVSFIPALVNKFTINYRLRGLLADWMGWDEARSQAENVFGSEAASTHLQMLAIMIVTLLAISIYRVERTEYPTQQEG